jgi:hypothetical protein
MMSEDTRTAADVTAKALFERFGAEWYYDPFPAMDNAYRDAVSILAALADAGYTIAGPGRVVVDQERWERVQDIAVCEVEGLMESGVYQSREGVYRIVGLEPDDLDPLSTQEGE